jgi:hypothetical protein
MSQPDSYDDMRAQFVDLCVQMAPRVVEAERRQNAPGEFDAFCGDRRVERVGLSPDGLAFVTTPLVMDGDCGPLFAGPFAIKIHVTNAAIQCRSLMRNATQTQHPHVSGTSFSPCLSSNAAAVTKLRGDGKLASLAIFMVDFLEAYDSRSAYTATVDDWKRLTAEEVTRWKSEH